MSRRSILTCVIVWSCLTVIGVLLYFAANAIIKAFIEAIL